MLFSQARIYRITDDNLNFSVEALEDALKAKLAREPGPQELSTAGFKAPVGKGEDAPLVFAADGYLMVCLQTVERILPGSVVRDELKEKVEQIETQQARKVYKKERDQLKDEIVQTLLPRAFIRRQSIMAAIAPNERLIIVNKATASRAEALLSMLRECMGSLPVRPIQSKISPPASMTDWIKHGAAPEGFVLQSDATFIDTGEDGGAIRAKNQDLASENIQNHIAAGMQVTELAIGFQDKLSLLIDEHITLKKIRFEDLLTDQAAQDGGDDEAGQYAASFILMMKTLALMIPALLSALGGEDVPQVV
jgi:recombination associated protein RdgC